MGQHIFPSTAQYIMGTSSAVILATLHYAFHKVHKLIPLNDH